MAVLVCLSDPVFSVSMLLILCLIKALLSHQHEVKLFDGVYLEGSSRTLTLQTTEHKYGCIPNISLAMSHALPGIYSLVFYTSLKTILEK